MQVHLARAHHAELSHFFGLESPRGLDSEVKDPLETFTKTVHQALDSFGLQSRDAGALQATPAKACFH